ncbi:MAG: DUF4097 family beta strand repeat protein [Erysipelotrichales bacterium]|nr:DUF4097 family beta strand repeat protein [Erysipelotrichales bacterium]
MKKKEYLERLDKALYGVSHEDAVRLIEYYRELIDDGSENVDEETFISKLEPPELVAENYRKEINSNNTNFTSEEKTIIKEKNEESNKKAKTPSVIRILLMIICVAFAFWGAIGLFILGVTTFSLVIYSVYLFVAAIVLMFSHPAVAFAQIGYAMILGSAGFVLGYIFPYIRKLYIFIIKILSLKDTKFEKPKFKNKYFLGFGINFVAGITIFIAAFGALGFSIAKLSCADEMKLMQETMEMPEESFTLISDNLGLEICYTDETEIKLEYYDFEKNPKTFTYANGKAELSSKYKIGDWGLIWERGVFFKWSSSKYYNAKLYLPSTSTLNVTIELDNGRIAANNMTFNDFKLSTDNGAIELNNLHANDVKISTSNGAISIKNSELYNISASADNGAISFENLTISNLASAKTQNGAVKMKSVNAFSLQGESNNGMVRFDDCKGNKLFAETDNGAIYIYRIEVDDIDLTSGNGSVSGTIVGNRSDYRIDAKTGLGSNNLNNKEDGVKYLKVRTGNGSVNIKFVE